MHPILTKALNAVGIPDKARFSIEEVAEILAIRREQVVDLLKKRKLPGVKSSPSRWRWVNADDLGAYLEAINGADRKPLVSRVHPAEVVPDDTAHPPPPNADAINTPPVDPMLAVASPDYQAAKDFVRWLGCLSTLDYQQKRIGEAELVRFYHGHTHRESPDAAPVFLEILREAIKKNDILIWEIGNDEAGGTLFGGVDGQELSDLFDSIGSV